MRAYLYISLAVILATTSCKKNDSGPSQSQSVLDSSLAIAKDYYLWYNQIPGDFKSSNYSDPNQLMRGIRQYSTETGFTGPVDRWSFGILKTEWDDVSSGISGDIGIGVFYHDEDDLRVTYVEPASAAGVAGVQRSWRITKLNGRTDLTYSQSTANFIVDAVYGGNTASITFEKNDGTTVELTLNPTTYQDQPILLDTVYTAGSKKIGYMVLNSFLGDIDGMKANFAKTFADFGTAGVTDLVVDLRYNGGGYVTLQEELANYLVPATKSNTLMYKETFNDKLTEYNESANFSKKGTLEPGHIVFIISQNTASASEALINIMRPQLTVKLVGPSHSTGKPVGYFPIPAGDWYVFPVSLRIVNSLDEGNYFNGFEPDKVTPDGLDHTWGDLDEDCLAAAYSYLTTGNFRSSNRESAALTASRIGIYNKMHTQKRQLLVETRSIRYR
ncbi:S41 family peptidase [Flavihumibacter petaseus]|uniref:Peptidase S41 family protein n=1 Tax=Flavihumibacter petaseus NBRC 106054 TaxID=1220578 RepID=A0A0E9N1P2_9BACT|nr:S41 family peptidase [Flavihumibacter petaseus]GAO43932.1 peptidase S41 family protein [Flavihumibacter petaseus NBRC 106054]